MGAKKSERSFVEIAKEMVSEGESFEEVISNLQLLGLSSHDAERLLDIIETKSEPEVKAAIDRMVKLKLETVDEAWQLKRKRHIESEARREIKRIKEIKYEVSALLRNECPEKIPVFRERIERYINALQEKENAKKDVLAFLLQLEKEKLLRRHVAHLKRAIGFFKESA